MTNTLKRLAAGLAAGATGFYSTLYLIMATTDGGLDLPDWAPIAIVGVAALAGTVVIAAMSDAGPAGMGGYAAAGLGAGLLAGRMAQLANGGLEWAIVSGVVILVLAAVSTAKTSEP